MALFSYTGKQSGKSVSSEITADTLTDAVKILRADSVSVLNIEEVKVDDQDRKVKRKPVKIKDVVQFTRQLYSLQKAGVPILDALTGMEEITEHESIKLAIVDVVADLKDGKALSESMKPHSYLFSDFYVNMVQVGEESGSLEDVFQSLVKYLEVEETTKKKMTEAMRYPTIMVIAIVAALMVMNFVVIPSFAGIFDKMNLELPIFTKILLGTSQFMLANWHFMLAGVVASTMMFFKYINTDSGAVKWGKFKINLPIFGKITRYAIMARFSELFAIAMRSGVPITQAILLVSGTVNNKYAEVKIASMKEDIENGISVAVAAKKINLFEKIVIQMLNTGEKTGDIEGLLNQVSDFYHREVDYNINRLAELMAPIITTILAGAVLVMILGIFMPIWGMLGEMMSK